MITAFYPGQEFCSATLHQTMATGETYVGPVHIGFYAETGEVFIEQEGRRIGIEAEYTTAFMREFRRAAKLGLEAVAAAKEQSA